MKKFFTGFCEPDKYLKICKGDLVVLCGRPAMGKTAFLINLLINFANNNLKCKFFSLEMSAADLKNRIWRATGYDKEQVEKIFSQVAIDYDPVLSTDSLYNKIEDGTGVIFLDGVQLLENPKTLTMEKFSRLKDISVRKNVIIFATSQIGRYFGRYAFKRLSPQLLLDKKEIWKHFPLKVIDKFIFIDKPYTRLSDKVIRKSNIKLNFDDFVIVKNDNGKNGRVEIGWDGDALIYNNFTKP